MKVKGSTWSRRSLVLALANQDGGAHVDPGLDEDYYHLSRRNLPGVQYVDDRGVRDATGNPAAAAVRQITYELLATFGREQPNVDPQVLSRFVPEEPVGETAGAQVVLGQFPVVT
jgi:hypothetical protein